MRPVPAALLALSLAAACGRAREGGGGAASGAGAPRNLGLAASGLVGDGRLWLVRFRESEQGARDANGDGDALDECVRVLDLERGFVGAPLAVAADEQAAAPALLACDGTSAAFAVDEAAHGGRDLNGDGDASDRVAFALARGDAAPTPLGFAVRAVVVGGSLVALAVDEAAHGGEDLDADGDRDGEVAHVFDLASGALRAFSLRDSRPLCVSDGRVALSVAERPGLDLNGDGDALDPAMLEIYDARTGFLHNTALALAAPAVTAVGATFGFPVAEAAQGRRDLSGDGDADDAVYHAYDPSRGLVASLGLAVPLYPPPSTDGRRFLLHALEEPSGLDANGDGDLEDLVVHVFEPETGLVFSTGLASQASAALCGEWVGVGVSEAMQGSRDLDGDGEAGGNVLHVLELASGEARALGLDAFDLSASPRRVFVAPFESLSGVDWTSDGDRVDRVLFDWSAAEERARTSGAPIGSVLAVAGDHALLAARESERGGDRNGDGDAQDLVLELFDAARVATRELGLCVGSAARLTERLDVLALVEEAAQGRDLNADEDLADEVLFVVGAR